MKKMIFFLFMFCALFVLSGCSTPSPNGDSDKEAVSGETLIDQIASQIKSAFQK